MYYFLTKHLNSILYNIYYKNKLISMKIRIITIIISLCFLSLCAIPSLGVSITKESEKNVEKLENCDTVDEGKISYLIRLFGPAKKISNIQLINGSKYQIGKINDLLSNKIIKPIIPIVIVKNLTFKITYKTILRLKSKYSFSTIYQKLNGTKPVGLPFIRRNIPHSITVHNFTGIFTFSKGKIFTIFSRPHFLKPAKFSFIGTCEEITKNPIFI